MDRQAVRNNAKYLRNVRPVDPDEICEYVDGRPHPGVVRQVLREEAFDLGLVERDDGTFVPVDDDPVTPRMWSPTAFPDRYAHVLEDRLVGEFGPDWHRGESGDELREAIRRLKTDYFYGNPVEYDERAALGYAIYHLPDYYAMIGYVLEELAEAGLLGRRLRVLDVGAGTGGPALGLFEYLPDDALVDYHAVEPSDSREILEAMLAETGRNFHTTVHAETAEAFDPDAVLGGEDEAFDVVLACNVLSELDDPVAVTEKYLDVLADDGSFLATAPADLETSTGLREVERAVVDGADGGGDGDGDADSGEVTVFSPTLRLWPGESPSDRGWSFTRRGDLETPGFQARLDEAGDDDGTFTNTDVQFSYATLRLDGRRRFDVYASERAHAKMAEMGAHVTERIDLLAVKLSHDIGEGDNPLYKISDGSEDAEHYAVLTKESVLNEDLARAPYGAVLSIENVLALWNDDERAFNLVVDAETTVDLVAG